MGNGSQLEDSSLWRFSNLKEVLSTTCATVLVNASCH